MKRIFKGPLALVGSAAILGFGNVVAFAATNERAPVDSGVGMTQAQIQEGIAAQNVLNKLLARQHHTMSATNGTISPNYMPGAYYNELGVQYQEQQQGSWCGPAAVSEALDWLGYGQTQANLAIYMGTTAAGTNFGEIPAALDHYTPTGYHWINLYSGSYSANAFSTDWANDMYDDIITKGNRPVVNDVQIGPHTEYLAGYSSANLGGTDIWHYLTTDGLTDGYSQGYEAHYEDSNDDQTSALGAWWYSASALEYDSYYGNGLTWATE